MADWGNTNTVGIKNLFAGSIFAIGGSWSPVSPQKILSVSIYDSDGNTNNKVRLAVYSGGDSASGDFNLGGAPVLVADLGEVTLTGSLTWITVNDVSQTSIPSGADLWLVVKSDSANVNPKYRGNNSIDGDFLSQSLYTNNISTDSSVAFASPADFDASNSTTNSFAIYLTHDLAAQPKTVFSVGSGNTIVDSTDTPLTGTFNVLVMNGTASTGTMKQTGTIDLVAGEGTFIFNSGSLNDPILFIIQDQNNAEVVSAFKTVITEVS